MNESPSNQKSASALVCKSKFENPEFASLLNEWCEMLIVKIGAHIKEQLPVYLKNNLQNTCSVCEHIAECAKNRTKYVLSNPWLNSPSFILYHKDDLPKNIKNYLRSHSVASVREYEWYLIFKLPCLIDFHWDNLIKRASADKQGEDGKINLKKYAGAIELPALKLNAIIKNIFWNLIEKLKKDKESNFVLHRINERGEHCGEYYYLLAVESKVSG